MVAELGELAADLGMGGVALHRLFGAGLLERNLRPALGEARHPAPVSEKAAGASAGSSTTSPLKRAFTGPIFSRTLAVSSVPEIFVSSSHPGMQSRRTSASFSAS